jgi:hypothetical protein
VLAGRLVAGAALVGAAGPELEPELLQPAAARATAAMARPSLACPRLLFLGAVAGIRSIAFSGGSRKPGRNIPRRKRHSDLVNYLIHNPGHNRVKCAEGTHHDQANWCASQCRPMPR